MKNIVLCIILTAAFGALYGACRLGNDILGIAGISGIAAVTIGALIKEPGKTGDKV